MIDAEKAVVAAVRKNFPAYAGELTRNTVASDVPGWDSLNHTLVVLDIETALGGTLPIEEVIGVTNLGELIDVVSRHRPGGQN